MIVERVYIGSDDGNVYALDRASGALRWVFTGGAVEAPPSVLGEHLVVGSTDGIRFMRLIVLPVASNGDMRQAIKWWAVRPQP